MILSSAMYFFHIAKLSESCGTLSVASPSKTVTYNLSFGILYTSVNNSQAQAIASSLK